MWGDGGPLDPSPAVDQAINGSYPWVEVECSRCKTPNDVDLAALKLPSTTCVHLVIFRQCRASSRLHDAFSMERVTTREPSPYVSLNHFESDSSLSLLTTRPPPF